MRSQSSVSPEPEKREEPAEKCVCVCVCVCVFVPWVMYYFHSLNRSTPSQVSVAKSKLTPQERLMKRMQAQLNKQCE